MRRWRYIVALQIVAMFPLFAQGQGSSTDLRESLVMECLNGSFVGVYAYTKTRTAISSVELSLADPRGGKQGSNTSDFPPIPHSRYADVFLLHRHPDRSKGRAVEICDAEYGIYEVTIVEHGAEPYEVEISVHGASPDGGGSVFLKHLSKDGRVRHYRFIFGVRNGASYLSWLDSDWHETLSLEDGEW